MRVCLIIIAVLSSALTSAFGAVDSTAGTEVLNTGSFWRWHLTMRPSTLPAANGVDQLTDPPPPADWAAPDFADVEWNRAPARELPELVASRLSSCLLALRGTFKVTNKAQVEALTLTLAYQGGARVLLNGKELARGHLPAGALSSDVEAEAYPERVYVDEAGALIPGSYDRTKLKGVAREDATARVAERTRRLGPIDLLPGLVDGVNVLAIELRRSPYDPVAAQWFSPRGRKGRPRWGTLNLESIKVVLSGAGIEANTDRPQGIQVWTQDIRDRVTAEVYGDPNETLQPLNLIGTRNGTVVGQVVLGSAEDIVAPRAKVSDLRQTAGDAVIAAADLAILYGHMDLSPYGHIPWSNGLDPTAPGRVVKTKGKNRNSSGYGAVLPIVVRAHIPRSTPAGTYAGVLTVSAEGLNEVAVPIQVTVLDWQLPEPRDFRTYVGIYQSPTTLALQYDVPEWSEAHWRLMERSLAMLARVGNKVVNIPVVDKTQFGNDEGMVYWVREADGTYTYDFSVFDRFMALALKHFGSLDHVVLHVWHAGGWSHRGLDQQNTVTVIDKATGERSAMQVPVFASAESKAFWKPVLDGLRQRLEKLDLGGAIALGILSDSTAPPEVFTMFDELIPGGAMWHRGCHTQTRYVEPYQVSKGGGKVSLHEHCYGLTLPDPAKPLPALHNLRGRPAAAYHRIASHEIAAARTWYSTFAERSLFMGTKGAGRICFDFWPVIEGKRKRKTWIYNRYPRSTCNQRAPSLRSMSWPGPNGAETTFRFEAFCLGLEDAEAAIVISEALALHADKLDPALADRCRAVLVDRLRYIKSHDYMRWSTTISYPNHVGWRDLKRRLYTCAADVSAAVGSPEAPAKG